MKESRITLAGQEIAFLESPGTGRAIILVHGNSSSSATWRHVMRGQVGQRYRCLALDLPGHGQSAPAADHSTYSLPGYASILAQFTDALSADHPVVVGWSLGGHIA